MSATPNENQKRRRGAPKKAAGTTRVSLAPQRVKAATLATLKQLGKTHGGVGKALDWVCQVASDDFAARYGFREFEVILKVGGEIEIVSPVDITGEQARDYFAGHFLVSRIETPSGYYLRD